MRRTSVRVPFKVALLIALTACADRMVGPRDGIWQKADLPGAPEDVLPQQPTVRGRSASLSDFSESFCSTTRINIPAATAQGVAGPYPSTIDVVGNGHITRLSVRLSGYTHTFPDDVDVLLVGPTGGRVILMSDNGGSTDISNVNLTFDDAAGPLPDASPVGGLASGTYRPTNSGGVDVFPAPAPTAPFSTTLAVFNGTNPDGQWRLFVFDDADGDSGALAGGFCLDMEITNDPPTVSLDASAYAASEGSPVAFVAGGTDPEGGALSWQWDWDNDGDFDETTTTGTTTHTYPDDYTGKMSVMTSDDAGNSSPLIVADVNITNVSPAITILGANPASIPSAGVLDASFSFTDPGPASDGPWKIDVNWGDGTPTQTSFTNVKTFSSAHTYPVTAGTYTATYDVTDQDGGVGHATHTVTVVDQSAPVLEVSITGHKRADFPDWASTDWYDSDVKIDWTFSDAESGIQSSTEDCVDATDTRAEVLLVTLTCTVTNGGGLSTSRTVQYRIDRTPPTLSPASIGGIPSPFAAGWYNSDVTVSWIPTDISPIHFFAAPDSPPQPCIHSVSGETSGTTVSCTATSVGGSTTGTATIRIDKTAPVVGYTIPAPTGANGWHVAPVAVTWNVNESISASTLTKIGCLSEVFSSDGAALGSSCTARSAGGESSDAVTFKLDRTAPVITPSFAGTVGTGAWYRSDVTVSWSVSDPTSGVTTTSCATTPVIGETAGTPLSCAATNGAGLEGAGTALVKIDKTPPAVTFNGVRTYTMGETVTISCSYADALSGIDNTTAQCTSINAPASSFGLGTFTVSGSVKDNAGNPGSATTTFTIVAPPAEQLCMAVRQFVSKEGVANSLCKKIEQAQKHAAKNAEKGKAKDELRSFVNEVQAQTGKSISPANAAILLAMAAALEASW